MADDPRAARLRERPQPRVPARAARPRRGRRLLGLARAMLAVAERQTPTRSAASTRRSTARCAAAGYTAVGEFHYLGFEEAQAAVEAAAEAGIELVLLLAAYARGGLAGSGRSRSADVPRAGRGAARRGVRVGVAPHSVRACPRDWLEEIGRYAAREGAAAARPRRRAAARDRGVPRRARHPADRAARRDRLPRPAHDRRSRDARRRRRARPARRAGARICVCPTTEANLGDGFLPVERVLRRAASGSASAPTRTSASTRSRSCASSRGSRAGSAAGATSSPSGRSSASAPTKARGARPRACGPTSRSTSTTPRCAASRTSARGARLRLRGGRVRLSSVLTTEGGGGSSSSVLTSEPHPTCAEPSRGRPVGLSDRARSASGERDSGEEFRQLSGNR